MRRGVIIVIGLGALIVALVAVLIFIPGPKSQAPEVRQPPQPNTQMNIESPSFRNNGLIPKKFTCDGENINPELQISGAPAEAKSLALIVDDPDIPDSVKQRLEISVYDHWVAFNISPDTRTIKEGTEPIGVAGLNSLGKTGYTGPCPPDREHRYFFKLYALDAMLDLKSGASASEFEKEINKHLLDKTELVGLYKK